MNNPATLEDVRDGIERPLTLDEERVIPAWLGKAWRELNRVVPAIAARRSLPEDDPAHLDVSLVVDVLVSMVERKVRNPGGLVQWNGDDYGEKVDPSMASGRIYVSAEELAKLSPPGPSYGQGIYSIPLRGM